jgi:hypothetical protein
MGTDSMRSCLTSFAVWLTIYSALLAGPKVEIIVAEKATSLEQRAAREVAEVLKRLYQAEATALATPSGKLPAIFIGNPATNPELDFAKADWPMLSGQGHLLKSTKHRNQPALFIGGGSPAATYWAAREYAHHLGVRTMLYGDLDPIAPPEFSLAGIDYKFEPSLAIRGWEMDYYSPTSFAAWTKAEQVAFVRQLAKLKFNRLVLRVSAGQPFIAFEAGGVQRKEGKFWNRQRFPVDGDTAGRSAFGGTKYFDNPDVASAKNEEERIAAAAKTLRSVLAEAKESGIRTAFHIEPSDLPDEFHHASFWDDAALADLRKATVRTYVTTYPEIEGVMIGVHGRGTHKYFDDQTIWLRPDKSSVPVASYSTTEPEFLKLWQQTVPTSREVVVAPFGLIPARWVLDSKSSFEKPMGSGVSCLGLALTSGQAYPLPQVTHSTIVEIAEGLKQHRWDGYLVTSHSGVGCLDLNAYLLSRNSFGNKLTADKACEEQLIPVCGAEVHSRVVKAFEIIEVAIRKAERLDSDSRVSPRNNLKPYESGLPPPEGWKDIREAYLNAMNEMYRANTRAREGSRTYTLYLARQFEFGFEYMNCLQALRTAGVAKKEKDREKQIAELEKAIDSINGACNALAAVARSNSDRGLIASMNVEVYRPLLAELEKAEAE